MQVLVPLTFYTYMNLRVGCVMSECIIFLHPVAWTRVVRAYSSLSFTLSRNFPLYMNWKFHYCVCRNPVFSWDWFMSSSKLDQYTFFNNTIDTHNELCKIATSFGLSSSSCHQADHTSRKTGDNFVSQGCGIWFMYRGRSSSVFTLLKPGRLDIKINRMISYVN